MEALFTGFTLNSKLTPGKTPRRHPGSLKRGPSFYSDSSSAALFVAIPHLTLFSALKTLWGLLPYHDQADATCQNVVDKTVKAT